MGLVFEVCLSSSYCTVILCAVVKLPTHFRILHRIRIVPCTVSANPFGLNELDNVCAGVCAYPSGTLAVGYRKCVRSCCLHGIDYSH